MAGVSAGLKVLCGLQGLTLVVTIQMIQAAIAQRSRPIILRSKVSGAQKVEEELTQISVRRRH